MRTCSPSQQMLSVTRSIHLPRLSSVPHKSARSCPHPRGFTANPGLGASALVEGKKILIGNQRLPQSNGVHVDALLAKAEQLLAAGATPVFV